MQHHVELEPGRGVLERRAWGEETVFLGHEEEQYSEGHADSVLQCGESLAIAANRIGEEGFGVTRLLRGFTRSVESALVLACIVCSSTPSSGRPRKWSGG
jgi:hypothetical protein